MGVRTIPSRISALFDAAKGARIPSQTHEIASTPSRTPHATARQRDSSECLEGKRAMTMRRDLLSWLVLITFAGRLPAAVRGAGHSQPGYTVFGDGFAIDTATLRGIALSGTVSRTVPLSRAPPGHGTTRVCCARIRPIGTVCRCSVPKRIYTQVREWRHRRGCRSVPENRQLGVGSGTEYRDCPIFGSFMARMPKTYRVVAHPSTIAHRTPSPSCRAPVPNTRPHRLDGSLRAPPKRTSSNSPDSGWPPYGCTPHVAPRGRSGTAGGRARETRDTRTPPPA